MPRSGVSFNCKTMLPKWVPRFISRWPKKLPVSPEALMDLAIELLDEHVRRETGGPFAALVVSPRDRRLVSVGLNCVVPLSDPTAHAETVALRLAASREKRFQFSGEYTLVCTGQMCGMCLTASLWAGVGSVVIGASAEDTERFTGFDEGIIAKDWKKRLNERGLEIKQGVRRKQVCDLYRRYTAQGGIIYNGQRGER